MGIKITDGGGGTTFSHNVETLTDNKALADGDAIVQILTPSGINRNVTLPATGALTPLFIIKNQALPSTDLALNLYNYSAQVLDSVYPDCVKIYAWDGTAWTAVSPASGRAGSGAANTGLGYKAHPRDEGVAIGTLADSDGGVAVGKSATGNDGTAVGVSSTASTGAVAVGNNADGNSNYATAVGAYSSAANKGTALGNNAEADLWLSVALGWESIADRANSITKNVSRFTGQFSRIGLQGFFGRYAAEAEPSWRQVYCEEQYTQHCLIPEKCLVQFTGTFLALDTNMNCAEYSVDALIKRDGANNTTLISQSVTALHEDVAGWNLQITADDVNEALKVEFMGNDSDTANYQVTVVGCLRFTQVYYS